MSPATLPPISLLLAIDDARLPQLAHSLPTWAAHRPEMLDWPVIVLCDGLGVRGMSRWKDEIHSLFHHAASPAWRGKVSVHGWGWGEGLPQRERMLTAFVHGARLVETAWHLKLDVDVIAEPIAEPVAKRPWIDPAWFRQHPAFIASPWGYTKPGGWLSELDDWAIRIGKWNCTRHFPASIDAERFSFPRIASWCFFGRTDWVRQQSEACGGPSTLARLPVPSHDTFLWYCALRNGDSFLRVRMRSHGWRHVNGLGMG